VSSPLKTTKEITEVVHIYTDCWPVYIRKTWVMPQGLLNVYGPTNFGHAYNANMNKSLHIAFTAKTCFNEEDTQKYRWRKKISLWKPSKDIDRKPIIYRKREKNIYWSYWHKNTHYKITIYKRWVGICYNTIFYYYYYIYSNKTSIKILLEHYFKNIVIKCIINFTLL
jgi:hypothetical protein